MLSHAVVILMVVVIVSKILLKLKTMQHQKKLKKAAQRKALSHITYSYAASAGCEKGSGKKLNG